MVNERGFSRENNNNSTACMYVCPSNFDSRCHRTLDIAVFSCWFLVHISFVLEDIRVQIKPYKHAYFKTLKCFNKQTDESGVILGGRQNQLPVFAVMCTFACSRKTIDWLTFLYHRGCRLTCFHRKFAKHSL